MIHLRPYAPTDKSFVYSSWLKSCRGDSDFSDIPKDKYFQTYKPHVDDLMSRSQVLVACDPTDHNFILGYIVFQEVNGVFILHWAYTKAISRKMGVFKTLLKSKFPALKEEPMFVTYVNERRRPLYERYKMIYKPEYRRIG